MIADPPCPIPMSEEEATVLGEPLCRLVGSFIQSERKLRERARSLPPLTIDQLCLILGRIAGDTKGVTKS